MDDLFVTDLFEDWQQDRDISFLMKNANRVFRRIGLNMRLTRPLSTGTMTSVEQRMNMFHLVASVLSSDVPGDMVELGTNEGQSAVLFSMVKEKIDPSRTLHVYDSFEGLPDVEAVEGEDFSGGQMAVGAEVLTANFKRFGLKLPEIHKGWFEETLPTQLPDAIAFAHLDGDLYASTMVGLQYVYPRLSPGAVCLLDDYVDPAKAAAFNPFPGVKQACDEFLADKAEEVSVLYAGWDDRLGQGSHGYFRKI